MTKRVSPATPTSPVAASIAARIARLTAALGEPFGEDPRLASYAMALAATPDAPPTARPPKEDFLARADAVLAAHEIALAVVSQQHARGDWANVTHRASALFDVESIRRGHVRTLAALKSIEEALFTQWNEGPLSETSAFWREVAAGGLPFVRRDLLGEIVAKGRITNREHYDYATDAVGLAGEEGGPSEEQAVKLKQMIGAYEKRGRK
jgi:hypothetical protein